jgi:hypothetical protein
VRRFKGDVITKATITRKGAWQRNLMQLKCSQTIFNNKEIDAKKQAAFAEEAKKLEQAKYTPVIAKKLAYFAEMRKEPLPIGLTYKM